MKKNTGNRLRVELTKLDELAGKGVNLLTECANDPENEAKKNEYFEVCMMVNSQFTDCAILLRDYGYAPDFEKAVKLLKSVGAYRLAKAI